MEEQQSEHQVIPVGMPEPRETHPAVSRRSRCLSLYVSPSERHYLV
jgi:hypothetical protein